MTAETMRKFLDVSTERGRQNRLNFNRKRVLRNVKITGSVPFASTMERYKLTPAEINTALEEGGYEPRGVWSVSDDMTPRFTGLLVAHNEEQQRLIDDFKKKASFNIVREKEQAIEKIAEELREQHTGYTTEVPAETQYSLVAFHEYFWRNRYPTGSRGQLASDGTIQGLVGARNTKKKGRTGRIYQVLKKYTTRDCMNNILDCLEHLDEIINGIKTSPSPPTSKRTEYNAIFTLMTQYERFKPAGLNETRGVLEERFPTQFKLLNDTFAENERLIEERRRETESTDILQQTWGELMMKVERTFMNSNDLSEQDVLENFKTLPLDDVKAYLYFRIYDVFPSRDDLGELKINPRLPSGNVRAESKMNYIYKRGGASVWTIVLNKYKTVRNWGRVEEPLTLGVSRLIDAWLQRPDVKDQEYLFMKRLRVRNGVEEKRKNKQGSEVKVWLEKADVRGKGVINLLRHTYVSSLWKDEFADTDLPSDELKKLAFAMRHAPITSRKYVREFASNLSEESIANYEVSYDSPGDREITSEVLPEPLAIASRVMTRSRTKEIQREARPRTRNNP